MSKIQVLLADDQDIIRTGLTIILNHQPDIEVVGQAADGIQAVEMAKALRPDVILMDVKMPRLNGIQATRQIVSALPKTQIIILTTYDTDDWVFDGIRAGAIGYLLKDASSDTLAEAVRGVSFDVPAEGTLALSLDAPAGRREALARACGAGATAVERERFATLWQDRVRDILTGAGELVEILPASV